MRYIKFFENYTQIDKLIDKLKKLLPEYNINVYNLDKKYIDDPRNKTKSSKCIDIEKDGNIFILIFIIMSLLHQN